LLGLEERFRLLAEQPALGKAVDHIREGYLRYQYGRHSIFYIRIEDGILIVRVLHASMDVSEHL
jgi:toxin ParE1/3/4